MNSKKNAQNQRHDPSADNLKSSHQNEPAKIPLDPILHQPVRTRAVAYLAARGSTTFSELKTALKISDGNLESHMKKLIAENYVKGSKKPRGKGRPATYYRLTEIGEEKFHAYIRQLEKLLKFEPDAKK